MMADTLRCLDLRALTISLQETDAPILLDFLQRLHGCHRPRRLPLIASAQLNIFLSRNDPASDPSATSEEDKGVETCDEEQGEAQCVHSPRHKGGVDKNSDGDDDESEVDDDDESEVDDDDDDDDEMEPVGRLYF